MNDTNEAVKSLNEELQAYLSKANKGKIITIQAIIVILMFGIWYGLIKAYALGMHNGVFAVLNFLTGSINGMEGNLIGGVISKTLILLCINTFVTTILLSRQPVKKRLPVFFQNLKEGLLESVSELSNLPKYISKKQYGLLGLSILGMGIALLAYPLISGNGNLENSFVLVLLIVAILSQLQTNKGVFIFVVHALLRLPVLNRIDEHGPDSLIQGMVTGLGLAVLIAILKSIPTVGIVVYSICGRFLGLSLFILGCLILLAKGGKA